jgi:hypothetical protein
MRTENTPNGTTVVDWVVHQAPDMTIMSASDPRPLLREHNAVAVTTDVITGRAIVLEWERIEPRDDSVGFVALGTPPERRDEPTPPGSDPQRVLRHTVRRASRGAVPGTVIGALVVTAAAWVVVGWSPALVGAAVGGGAIGAVAGAFFSFVAGTGWGAAYRDSFVEPGQADLVVASIHSDEPGTIDAAIEAATRYDDVRIHRVGPGGDSVEL